MKVRMVTTSQRWHARRLSLRRGSQSLVLFIFLLQTSVAKSAQLSLIRGQLLASHVRLLRRSHRNLNRVLQNDAIRSSTSIWDETLRRLASDVNKDNVESGTSRSNNIEGDDDQCSSHLTSWAREKARQIGFERYSELVEHDVPFILYVFKHYIHDGRYRHQHTEYFGKTGEYTQQIMTRHEETKLFWQAHSNVDGNISDLNDKVALLGMHGNDLAKISNLVETLTFMYPEMGRKEIRIKARSIQRLVEMIPDTYDNPLLSLNALAAEADWVNGEDAPDALLIGDGLLDFLNDSDLPYGSDFIYSHEFSHHIQFHLNIDLHSKTIDKWNANRRAEIMADEFTGYFLAHPDGGGLDKEQILRLGDVAFYLGDCKENNAKHHGIPEQRRCATLFGSRLALKDSAGGRSERLMDSLRMKQLQTLFDDSLPSIILLDAEVCDFDSIFNDDAISEVEALGSKTHDTVDKTFGEVDLADGKYTSQSTFVGGQNETSIGTLTNGVSSFDTSTSVPTNSPTSEHMSAETDHDTEWEESKGLDFMPISEYQPIDPMSSIDSAGGSIAVKLVHSTSSFICSLLLILACI